MSFLAEAGNFLSGLTQGKKIDEDKQYQQALKYGGIANKNALNSQLELIDKSTPIYTGAYSKKRLVDAQARTLENYADVAARGGSNYRFWD